MPERADGLKILQSFVEYSIQHFSSRPTVTYNEASLVSDFIWSLNQINDALKELSPAPRTYSFTAPPECEQLSLFKDCCSNVSAE